MDFWAGSQVLLGVCEEVVWTGAGEEGSADFGVGDGELSGEEALAPMSCSGGD